MGRGFGGGRMPGGKPMGLGCGGIVLILVISFVTGNDPLTLLQLVGGGGSTMAPSSGGAPDPGSPSSGPPSDTLGEFASQVLADTEDTWNELYPRMSGNRYREPTLVLFSGSVRSACGFNSSATGPFYCPADQQVYIDLAFFDELQRRFGAPGDFAQAYVLAHEVGHHVQNLLGLSTEVQRARQRMSREDGNRLLVRLELMADCLAGVWGHAAAQRNLLEPGDIEEGLRAAAAIGDDAIQRQAQGYVVPESFTHGTSEQRVEWLTRGLRTGDPDACETFQ